MEFGKLGQFTPGPVIQQNQNLTQQDCTCSPLCSLVVPHDRRLLSTVSRNGFSSQGLYGLSGGMHRPYGGMNMLDGSQPQVTDKGKGKMRAEDFDVAFAQATVSYQTESATIEEVQDVTASLANTTLEDTGTTKPTTSTSEDFKT